MRRLSRTQRGFATTLWALVGLLVLVTVFGGAAWAGKKESPASESLRRGLGEFSEGRYPEAADAFKQATQLDPANPVAFNNLGLAYVRMGKTRDAIDAFEAAVALRPTSANFHYNLARVYQLAKNYPKAIEHYEKTVTLDPGNALAHAHLGQLYGREEERYPEAVEELKKSITLDPDNPEAHYALAVAYFSLKNFDESWRSVREAERLGYTVNPAFLKALRQVAPPP